MTSQQQRTTLVIGHPGHELRVFRWLEINQPDVFVLTDGSGRSGRSRLDSTTRILDRAGAHRGTVYGKFTDLAVYAAILRGDHDLFVDLARDLAQHLIDNGIEYVVGDPLEGREPTHDICRLIIDAAVTLASRAGDRQIGNFDFALTQTQGSLSQELCDQVIQIQLDDQAYERKMSAALEYKELQLEVEKAIRVNEADTFRVEQLRPVSNQELGDQFATARPYYETRGEARVAAGHYSEVIRYRQHIVPLAQALRRHVEEELRCHG